MQCKETPDYTRRFGGVRRLYGEAGLAKLQAAHVVVIGIGGGVGRGRQRHWRATP
jgi:tRNA A37 threonylcarbamoyladenosine dehydratase